jgi:hypothetical protein
MRFNPNQLHKDPLPVGTPSQWHESEQTQGSQSPVYKMFALRTLVITEAGPSPASLHFLATQLELWQSSEQLGELDIRWECCRIIGQLPSKALSEAVESLKNMRDYYTPVPQLPSSEPKVSIIPALPGTVMQRPAITCIAE